MNETKLAIIILGNQIQENLIHGMSFSIAQSVQDGKELVYPIVK